MKELKQMSHKLQPIRYVKSAQIDREKWDLAVANSAEPLIYGLSIMYDTFSENWGGLVVGDYEAVMPLPYKFKWGIIPFVYQPPFVQQSGIYAPKDYDQNDINRILKSIPLKFMKVYTRLNYSNAVHVNPSENIKERVSYELDLNNTHENLRANYNKDGKKNLKKIADIEYNILEGMDVPTDWVVDAYISTYSDRNPNLNKATFNKFYDLIDHFSAKGMVKRLAIVYEDRLLAAGIFLFAFDRLHYILGAPTQEGKKYAATHTLIDLIVQKHAETPVFLDFEGSMIPSVAQFYMKFGSTGRKYYEWKR